MPVPLQSLQRIRFRRFELDLTSGELRKDGQKVPLPPKAFEVLRALVEHPGEVVTREDLRTRLWPADTFVEFDDSLNHAVRTLRQALGDSAEDPQFIETLPRFGYRFILHNATATTADFDLQESTHVLIKKPTGGSRRAKLRLSLLDGRSPDVRCSARPHSAASSLGGDFQSQCWSC